MNVAYVYPWDVVGDPAAAERIAALGVTTVALAASYHSTRAATPHHPAHRVLDVPHSAFYLPVRPEAWGRLTPAAPSWTSPDAYLLAQSALRAAGLRVHAWTVLTHNAHLGTAFPDLVVRNAFGDPYPYALCPSAPDVAEYCERLVREILVVAEPDGLILEGCGPMGFTHQSVHEKTAGADYDPDLMSLCFCASCTPRYPTDTRSLVRTALDTLAHGALSPPPPATSTPTPPVPAAPASPEHAAHTSPHPSTSPPRSTRADAHSPANPAEAALSTAHPTDAAPDPTNPIEAALGTARPTDAAPNPTNPIEAALGPLADEVRRIRVDLSASLRHRLITAAREAAPDTPITLHANPDPWATGPFAALPTGDPGADVLVGNCWGDPSTDAARLTRLADLCTPGQRVGAYVLALPPRPADAESLAELLTIYAKAGASEFHLYHAGLASPQRLAAMTRALTLTSP
ncbi:hypothetical protein [Nonomuraea sp. NPDC048826]|uniref:hypothetical protein n=1 Tax=Nonomuraea sp. NPDC048826 TaxID=3364347 RepID=UPI00371703E1